ncbi:DsbE family thiol:disulfide interchange protein [Hellea balneolensis]|uniref:DsbE family thiol:disulfide interchange protein n=1 Tax=Hellea balneolensis TaxID=287478 RepID=UPI0004163828|nr:DsbE family thiol:disulfide interchange protein [Hellea balneolensis]
MRALIPIALFLLMGLAFAVGLTKDPKLLPSELLNKPVPKFTLSELYDETETLTQEMFKGKVSLINVFGSWCVACNVEHPVLMEISKRGDVNLIGVDWRDTRPKAKAWLEKGGNPYRQIIFDNESVLAIKLGVSGAPESFITDKSGHIRYKHVGVITPKVWQETLLPLVETLKAE